MNDACQISRFGRHMGRHRRAKLFPEHRPQGFGWLTSDLSPVRKAYFEGSSTKLVVFLRTTLLCVIIVTEYCEYQSSICEVRRRGIPPWPPNMYSTITCIRNVRVHVGDLCSSTNNTRAHIPLYFFKSLRLSGSWNFTFPSFPTLAKWKPVGTSFCCFVSSSAGGSVGKVTADCSAPGGLSAISLTSLDVKTSLMRDALDESRRVVGPRNCRKRRSPQIVLLADVLKLYKRLVIVLHVFDSDMTLKNLTSCTRRLNPRLGIWNRRLDDLNRYGRGGCCVMVYATTFPGCATYSSPAFKVT